MSSTEASDQDTSRHIAGSSWPHDHQPNESYYGSPPSQEQSSPILNADRSNDSEHSQRVFTQQPQISQQEARLSLLDVEREMGYVDVQLVEMVKTLLEQNAAREAAHQR